jgi:photosystem II stability/assembly factor-like uncharacterized protein
MNVERRISFSVSALPAAILFCAVAAGPLAAESGGEQESSDSTWQCVTCHLWGRIPGYHDSWSGNRRCGGLRLSPAGGKLYIGLNDTYGVYCSEDGGKTFRRCDDEKLRGRWVDPCAMQTDPKRPGALAVFKVGKAGGMTLDGGETWSVFTNESKDGWSYGMVDWTAEKPVRIFARAHHSPDRCYSSDAGKTWQKIPCEKDTIGIALTRGALLCSRRNRGIFRSEDLGQSWQKVSEARTLTKTPATHGQGLYWPTKEGLIVSRDAGKTWVFTGGKIEGILCGPRFGKDPKQMMLMTEEGFFRTDDGGETWKKQADFFLVPKAYKQRKDVHDFDWDFRENILYVSALGAETWARKLEDPGS